MVSRVNIREEVGAAVIDGIWEGMGTDSETGEAKVDREGNAANISIELRKRLGVAVSPDEAYTALWGTPDKFTLAALVSLVGDRIENPKFWV